MFFTVQITDNWLISARAKRVYITSALLTVVYFGLLIAIELGATLGGGSLQHSHFVVIFLKILLIPCVLGMAVMYVGMSYFWIRCHGNERTSKVPWLPILLGLGPIGSLLYFAFFYLHSPLVRPASKQQAATA
jgi:hypothetical protein